MKVSLKSTYKSLRPFESEELAKLTIITGNNGSGKTQFLELFKLKMDANNDVKFIIDKKIENIQIEGIINTGALSVQPNEASRYVTEQWEIFNRSDDNVKYFIYYILNNNLLDNINENENIILEDKKYVSLLEQTTGRIPGMGRAFNMNKLELNNFVLNYLTVNTKFIYILDEVNKYTGKPYDKITEVDFLKTPLERNYFDTTNLFYSKIEKVFYKYLYSRYVNRQGEFNKLKYKEKNNSITDEKFILMHKEPWVLINELLEAYNIDFCFKSLDIQDFLPNVAFEFSLMKKSTRKVVNFDDLSSGEKIIIGLIMKLFTTSYYDDNLILPDLIILDEPDAHLHPQMSKLLIDILENTFVNTLGIEVIMTTHSPSTIALAPENSIYEITNGRNTSLKKVTKDDALKILDLLVFD